MCMPITIYIYIIHILTLRAGGGDPTSIVCRMSVNFTRCGKAVAIIPPCLGVPLRAILWRNSGEVLVEQPNNRKPTTKQLIWRFDCKFTNYTLNKPR